MKWEVAFRAAFLAATVHGGRIRVWGYKQHDGWHYTWG